MINHFAPIVMALISLVLIIKFKNKFTSYEKIWFISVIILSSIFAVLFPEEDINGVNGNIIMTLYLADIFFNVLCELLISKQSRYNFLVSLMVEIVEILICVVLKYRFATMAVTLFFWIPIDIVSYINWSNHKDEEDDELTIVRKLSGNQRLLVILAIVIWTIGVGYLISGINIQTDFIQNKSLETTINYLDACASAVGVANGLFILFRLQEQWIAWYICSAIEMIINILTGQYVLIILKIAYFTNTTYGYIKWNKYIKKHSDI